ncbi:GumC family protein [Rhizobium sp. RAF56]|uniref:GumC family protein n=1 Tax=Rhizobium sp. RAF56 TaxID=3233062 RepID=UPI003F98D36C
MFSVGVPKMNDVDVRFYLSILLQRLPYVLGIAGLAVGISVGVASYLPPVYRASARILAEAPQIPVDLVRSTVSMNGMEQLQIVQQQITTRDDLLALADKLDIYADSETKPSNEKIVDDMRARITFDQLQLNSDSSGAAVFSVGFQAKNPVLAAKVANELATLILHRNQRQRADVAGSTLQFFDDEVARLGEELNRTEADILRFKNENKDTLPDSLEFRRQQQNSQQARLVSLDREESDLRSRRRNLVETYGTSGQLMTAGPISPEQQMLTDLNRALAEQLGMFAETSPSVVALRARIASLQARLHPTGDTKTDRTVGGKPVTLLDMQLADIDERLQLIARERSTIVKNVADLTKSIEATPAVETVMNALERTRTNLQTQYNTAIAKRAEASIGKQVEANSDGERFSLLESATPPEKKISPKRWRIVGMGAAAGVALGLGFALLLEMLNKTIRRSSEVTQVLQTQLLATIPYIDEPRRRRIANRYYPVPLMGAFRKFRSG